MSYLTLDADRLVRDAVDAYLEERLRPDSSGDCIFATRNSQYRIVEGVVHEATDTSLMGAELVGWLCEELGQPLMEARWRPYGRAVFVERRSRHVVVTSRTLTRTVVSGKATPVPKGKRRPSVIPAAPPIPVLRSSTPPPPDGSPTPFRVPESVRKAAISVSTSVSSTPEKIPSKDDESERPTTRPPPEEATVAAERSSYEDLLEASRTPTWSGGPIPAPIPPVPPPAPTRPIQLPPPRASLEKTAIGKPPIDPDAIGDTDIIAVLDEDADEEKPA